ncbi:transporter [Zhihengliuella halotolerans]|uniref:ABC-2 type transport system permease protein n=1 Tax=Zhihengliuella halotolerans TaxID=370736 RepID=A0A4Q8ADE8_9MICC|nr:transporter [Zhihengliuella halotolerans]RZU61653.1 ABC-2 type transport system permease protein [Zhihengliuella halotolerans]
MVAELIRLKARLLANGFRRSPWQLVGVLIGAAYALFIAVMLIVGMFGLGSQDPGLIRTVLVCSVSVVVLAWAIVPVLLSGADATLDPAKFATFPVPRRDLTTGLLLSGFVGTPGAVTLVLFVAIALSWRQSPAAAFVAVVAGVLAALFCLALARLTTTAALALTSKRRFREIATILIFIPLVALGPILGGLQAGVTAIFDLLPTVAGVLAWTPLGVFAALPADALQGEWGIFALRLLVALASLAVVVWAWSAMLMRSLQNPVQSSGGSKGSEGLGLLRLFPATPWGAIAGRCLTYWFKDPRYAAGIVIVPLLPFILWYASSQSPTPYLLYAAAPLMAVMMGFSISADVSYDSTAFSLHVTTAVRGVHDRAGRALACGALALPLVLAAAIIPPVALGRPGDVVALVGVTLGGLLSALGVASVASARWTYAVVQPGDNPFKSPPGAGARAAITQLVTMFVAFLLMAPEIALVITYFVTERMLFAWLALGVGLVVGTVLLIVGIRVGGRWFDNRMPELMEAVTLNK